MLCVRSLTPDEVAELARRLRTVTKTKEYMRLKTIDLSHQGYAVQEIARLLDRHPNSIRSYLHRFNQGGWAALMPQWRGGTSRKLVDLGKAYWDDLLTRPPAHFPKLHSQAQRWTYALLQQYLHHYEGRTVHPNTIWWHLRRIKYTAGRAKLSVTSPDPDYQVKRTRVETLEKKVGLGA